jgi:hypothetical protein
MKVSANFDIREFVPKATWDKWKERSIWFIRKEVIELAEFYKSFFLSYYQKSDANIVNVLIVVNNWHTGGTNQNRGYRPPSSTVGGTESQHRFGNAFDCDIIIVYKNGTKKEADYKEIHKIISDNYSQFRAKGLSTIESLQHAPTWLHSDLRWTNSDKLLIVSP